MSKKEIAQLKKELEKAEKDEIPYECIGEIMDRIKKLKEEKLDPYIALYKEWPKDKWTVVKISKQEFDCWGMIDKAIARTLKHYPNKKKFYYKVLILGEEIKR